MFMTYKRAQELLEREHDAEMSMGEIIAEAGMGAVSLGFDPYAGMSLARLDMEERQRQWEEDHPEEAAHRQQELHTARAVVNDFYPLELHAEHELFGSLYVPYIPEYRLDYRRPAPTALDLSDDIPF